MKLALQPNNIVQYTGAVNGCLDGAPVSPRQKSKHTRGNREGKCTTYCYIITKYSMFYTDRPGYTSVYNVRPADEVTFLSLVLLSLIRVFVIEFIDQYNWFGLSSTVHSCLFLMCATDEYFYLMFYV